jgi:heme/copper-type cytochrome/quinol oxidase subunit 3
VKAAQPRASQRIQRPTTSRELALRTHPLVFGVVLFLVADLMIFAGLLATYFTLRQLPGQWPPAGVRLDETSAAVGTAMLAASSATMLFTTHYLARNAFTTARVWLGATILLGTTFVLLTIHGWSTATFRIDSHAYGSVYFATTGFHALHVLAGVLLLVMLFFNMNAAAFERNRRAGAEAIGYFWHFVFAIWLLVWGSIFVIR